MLVALLGLGAPALATAQGATENAEARVYFAEGNRLYQEAADASGAARTTLLQRALGAYVDSVAAFWSAAFVVHMRHLLLVMFLLWFFCWRKKRRGVGWCCRPARCRCTCGACCCGG